VKKQRRDRLKRKRLAREKFLMEQKRLAKYAHKNNAAVEYAIAWKRKPGVYEDGATGPRCWPLPPERWSVFRRYKTEAARDKVFAKVVEKRTDAEWRRIDV